VADDMKHYTVCLWQWYTEFVEFVAEFVEFVADDTKHCRICLWQWYEESVEFVTDAMKHYTVCLWQWYGEFVEFVADDMKHLEFVCGSDTESLWSLWQMIWSTIEFVCGRWYTESVEFATDDITRMPTWGTKLARGSAPQIMCGCTRSYQLRGGSPGFPFP